MNDDKRHLQLRLDRDTRRELERISRKYGISNSDVIRGVIFLGIPVFEAFTALSGELVKRLAANLKKEARLRQQ